MSELKSDSSLDAQIELASLRQELAAMRENRLKNSPQMVQESQRSENQKSLKSDVKKSTAFVKRMHGITPDGLAQCIRETESLNLSKFLEEIVKAILETTYKATDVSSLASLCGNLHRRYEEFSARLIPDLKNSILLPAADDDKDAPKRRRLQIRLMLDLFVTGIFTEDAFFLQIVRLLLGIRKAGQVAAAAVDSASAEVQIAINKKAADLVGLVAFVKLAHETILGFPSARVLAATTAAGIAISEDALSVVALAEPGQQTVPVCLFASARTCLVARGLVTAAYEQLADDLVAAHKDYRSKDSRFEKERLLYGTLKEDKQTVLDNSKQFFERMLSVVQSLSEVLDRPLPELVEEREEPAEASGSKGISVFETISKEAGNWGPFGDSETKSFYEDIPDLLSIVPCNNFNMTESQVQAAREAWKSLQAHQREREHEEAADTLALAAGGQLDEPSLADLSLSETPPSASAVPEVPDANSSTGEAVADASDGQKKHARLVSLLEERLPECLNRAKVDAFCEDFCYVNGKNARKRLLEALGYIPRGRTELVPNYARVIATFHRIYPTEFAEPVLIHLRKQFLGQLHAKHGGAQLSDRIRTARYIAEMVKFRVAPPISAFQCYEHLLRDFGHSNIDVIAAMLEHCGRFLLLLPHTHARMSRVLDTVLRLKAIRRLDVRQSALLESAYFTVKPPERVQEVLVELTPVQKFIYFVVAKDRHATVRSSVAKTDGVNVVVRSLRRLPWSNADEHVQWHVMQAILQVVETVYAQIPVVAAVLTSLNFHHSNLFVRTVDVVLERVRRSLDVPYRREPQKLLGLLRFIAELHVSDPKALPSKIIYDMLYMIVHHSHARERDALAACAESAGTHTSPSRFSRGYDPCIVSDLDPPTDCFRALMVCEALNACGGSLARSAAATREHLSEFLMYFQRWLLSKPSLPMHIEFAALDLFDLLEAKALEWDAASASQAEAQAQAQGSDKRRKGKKAVDKPVAAAALPASSLPATATSFAAAVVVSSSLKFARYDSLRSVQEAIHTHEQKEIDAARDAELALIAGSATASEVLDGAASSEEEGEGEGEGEGCSSGDESDEDDNSSSSSVSFRDGGELEGRGEGEGNDDGSASGESSASGSQDDSDDGDSDDDDDDDSGDSDDDEDSSDDSEGSDEPEQDSDEEIVRRPAPQKTSAELAAEDEFELSLRQMQQDSAEAARGSQSAQRRAQVKEKLALPTVLPAAKNVSSALQSDAPTPAQGMQFRLVTRDSRGKVETRNVLVPDSAEMVAKLRQRQENEREERQRAKEHVLARSELEQSGALLRRQASAGAGAGGSSGSGGGLVGASSGRGAPAQRSGGGDEMGLDEFLHETDHAQLRAVQERTARIYKSGGGSAASKPPLPPLEANPNRERW